MCVKSGSKSESSKAVKSGGASSSVTPGVAVVRRTSRRSLGAVMTRSGDQRSSSSQKRGSTKPSSSPSASSVEEEQVGVVVCPDPREEQESTGSGSPPTTRTTTTSSCPTPRAAKSSSNSFLESKVVNTTLPPPSADAGASISSETCGTSSALIGKPVCQENEPSQDGGVKKRCSSNPADETGNRASNTVKHSPKRACLVKTTQSPMVTGGLQPEELKELEEKEEEEEEDKEEALDLEETATKKNEIIGGSKALTRRALLTPPPPSMVVEVTTESGARLREPRRIGEYVETNDGQSRNLAPVVTLASSGELLGDSSGVVVSCVSAIGGPLEQQQQQQQEQEQQQQQRSNVPKVPVKSEQDLLDTAANGLPDDRKRHLIGDEFYNKATGDPAISSSTDPLGLPLNEAGPQGAQNVVVGLPVDLGNSLPSLVSADDLDCPSGTAAIIYEAGSIVSQAPVSLVLSEGLIKRDTILTSHPSSIGDAGVILYSHSQALDTPISLASHNNSHHPHHHNHQHQLEDHAHHHHAHHSPTDKLTAATITLYSTEDLPNTTVVTSGGSNGGGVTGTGSLVPVSLSSGDHHGGFDGGVSVGASTGVNTSGTGTLTDMASLLAQAVKNEPEDLTGHRRDSDNEHDISHLKEAKLESSSPVGLTSHTLSNSPVVVLSSADLVNNQFPTIVTSPGDGQPTSYPSPSDLFESSSRSIYATSEPYRAGGQPGDDLYQGGFVHSRASTDVQFVEYYRTNGNPPPPGAPHINSPDSGIGDPNIAKMFADGHPPPSDVSHPGFEHYPHSDLLNDIGGASGPGSVGSINGGRKSWQDYGRQSEEKIHIPKLFTPYGFKYILEAPSSSSVRREDDKITYVNKGQFYPVCLEYTPDPELPPLKSATVKSIIMLVFREGKTIEEEMKAWQFWHARQHSVKQRILDVDTKNSLGLTGCIEEISHNALAVYWNPMECQAKVNIAVQCLSTDFSTQKGVKGLPLHLQIDTFDDPRDNVGMPVYHRGYCQIKVFCDKGAERKARDEERRANKRRLTNTGKRRLDEMYHTQCDRSEFYSMADLNRGPVLFNPPDDPDKAGIEFGTEVPGFYNSRPSPPESLLKLNGSGDSVSSDPVSPQLAKQEILATISPGPAPRVPWSGLQGQNHTLLQPPPEKRIKLIPPTSERVMIYIKQETELAFTPLHLVPPNVPGLIRAIESKYKINAGNIRFLYRKNKGGILAKIDDEMLKYYSNEDSFLMQVMVTEGAGGEDTMIYDITLTEC